jgi:soluble lytic murein transglycosylase
MNNKNAYQLTDEDKDYILEFSNKFHSRTYGNKIYKDITLVGPFKKEAETTVPNNEYSTIVRDTAKLHNVDPGLVMNVIRVESGFNPKALNKGSQARGLMQITPIAEQDSKNRGVEITDIYDVRQNINTGTFMLSNLIKRFGDVRLALAAYNAGPGTLNKWIDRYGKDWDEISRNLVKRGEYKETTDYVNKVLNRK